MKNVLGGGRLVKGFGEPTPETGLRRRNLTSILDRGRTGKKPGVMKAPVKHTGNGKAL